ncbi:hypothetical protein QMZ92_19295 [Streptomyces sp. HNM0645]|uniref:hypothetical protein n=1 Tax=Streptomyces sp. HNM0645 TaxID=2782343 RepID=UPI0024B7FA5F|nr:hypothetical protein [Streptomyces sp. HNM0645]MDI9886462.1 hypothetical protein [Streptomyces sp. HNM0645]
MSGRRSLVWLGLTPEPERELPPAVAALRTGAPDAGAEARGPAAAERRRVERLILHGSERSWLRYLAEVTELVTSVADGTASGDRGAALVAGEVVLDHHRMLIGLPGSGYDRTARDRSALETAVRTLRAAMAGTPGTASSAAAAAPGSPGSPGEGPTTGSAATATGAEQRIGLPPRATPARQRVRAAAEVPSADTPTPNGDRT